MQCNNVVYISLLKLRIKIKNMQTKKYTKTEEKYPVKGKTKKN